jgi:hypothetical protein
MPLMSGGAGKQFSNSLWKWRLKHHAGLTAQFTRDIEVISQHIKNLGLKPYKSLI